MTKHDDWVRAKLGANARVQARNQFQEYIGRPCEFAVDVLGLKMWHGLESILMSLRDNQATWVCGGHKLSKTTANVAGSLWWCGAEHPGLDGRWAAVLPSYNQLCGIFWQELTKQLDRLADERPRVREMLGPELGLDPRKGWKMSGGAQIIGVATSAATKVAGYSAPYLVINIDEGTGYPRPLFNAWQGNEAADAKMLNSSNPTSPEGWFYDGMFDGEANVIRLSAFDSPNVIEGKRVIPGLAGKAWVEKMGRKYGPNPELNPEYQIRVLGQFPKRTENAVISNASLHAAQERWTPQPPPTGQLVMGIDPSRYGVDECVIQAVRGSYAYPPLILSGALDGKDIAEAAVEELRRLRDPRLDRTTPIVVDSASSGASPTDFLRHHPACVETNELSVLVHEGFRVANDEPSFANLRTEVWFGLNEWLKTGAVQPGMDIRKETAAAFYKFDSQARKVMESKEKMKKRLGQSPNRADALTLAVSTDVSSSWALETAADLGMVDDDDDFDDDW